jgi:purine-binding chemotaxis protein CheW
MEPTLEKIEGTAETTNPEGGEAGAGAETLAAPVQTKAEYRMIAFSLAGRDYGIDIMKVKEISHEGKFTYVPNTAPFVLGVHNLRGEIIPIIDMRRMFNLAVERANEGVTQNVLILKLEKLVLGMVVDSIDGVMSAPADSVQPPHPLFSDINLQYISGVVEREGKLYVILDVERIFAETTQAPKAPVKAEIAPVAAPVAAPGGDQDLRFVCEGLATFASFFVTPMNLSWVERRFEEWRKLRKKQGVSVQLGGADDAREFLSIFSSPPRGQLWADAQRKALTALLPGRPAGTYVVWNHGCGRGFDAYSVVCALKSAYPSLAVKTWANDGNLVEIASAPTLTLPKERVPEFYIAGGFMRETEAGCQFTPAVRESVIFEYTESLARTEGLEADLIVSRDVLSFMKPETQKTVLEAFAQRLKPGGLLVLGANEQVAGEGWRSVEKGGMRAFVREIPKE